MNFDTVMCSATITVYGHGELDFRGAYYPLDSPSYVVLTTTLKLSSEVYPARSMPMLSIFLNT